MARTGATLDAVIEMQVDDAALVGADHRALHLRQLRRGLSRRDASDQGCRDLRRLRVTNLKRRADDNAETLKTRLMEYYKKTSPLIGYYYAKGQLSAVDGLAEVDAVADAIAKVLDKA